MKNMFVFAMCIAAMPAFAMNDTANMLRRCEGVNITNTNNYILRCRRDDDISRVISDGVQQFFAVDNDGDIRGSFLDEIPENDDFVYVNVVRNSPDTRYSDQICYRFIQRKDERRDGFYAVQVCEYERADYYL